MASSRNARPVVPAAALAPTALMAAERRAPLGRRTFILGSVGAAAAVSGLAGVAMTSSARAATTAGMPYPFTLGVASGDPLPDSVVLWTRLAPEPLSVTGGMPDAPVDVEWTVRDGSSVVASGTATATAALGHSVHVDVRGLRPGREYTYRFRVGGAAGHVSPEGRTRTAPTPGADVAAMTIAVSNCQDWQNGYWPGYADLAANPTDLVLHLGDYIYEYAPQPDAVRPHNETSAPELDQLVTLGDYRTRHALYRTDPSIQAAHAASPWILVWDDHEFENNYADLVDEEEAGAAGYQDPAAFAVQRAAAYQAWYEHTPARVRFTPGSPDLRIYRRFDFGRLLRLNMLDTRQYRTDQVADIAQDFGLAIAGRLNVNGSMTGAEQEAWLAEGLRTSGATWNVIGQQTIFAPTPFLGIFANLDQWDGYAPARNRLIDVLAGTGGAPAVRNPIVLTGDIHSTWVNDVRDHSGRRRVVGTEFVAPSMSSDFPDFLAPIAGLSGALSRDVRYFNGAEHGYLRCTVTPQEWITEVRTTADLSSPTSPIAVQTRWRTVAGTPGAVRA